MRLIQHVDLEPGWPEFGFTGAGECIRLADVEATFPPGTSDRGNVYFLLADGRTKCWPWREAGYYVDDDGNALAPVSNPAALGS